MNIEINLTLRCNRSCWACNRMCGIMPYSRADDVTLEQIDAFLEQAQAAGVGKCKVLGGEPLMHPQFEQIYNKLLQGFRDGVITALKIDHNHTLPFPKHLDTHGVRIMGTSFHKKCHLAMIHPLDAGQVTVAQPRCDMLRRCGFALDAKGWLPCSAAIVLERIYNFGLYRDKLPTQPWGLDQLCPNCPFSMPKEWRDRHTYHLDAHPTQYDKPSLRYRQKLAEMELQHG